MFLSVSSQLSFNLLLNFQLYYYLIFIFFEKLTFHLILFNFCDTLYFYFLSLGCYVYMYDSNFHIQKGLSVIALSDEVSKKSVWPNHKAWNLIPHKWAPWRKKEISPLGNKKLALFLYTVIFLLCMHKYWPSPPNTYVSFLFSLQYIRLTAHHYFFSSKMFIFFNIFHKKCYIHTF
jgi:hypothetical protein